MSGKKASYSGRKETANRALNDQFDRPADASAEGLCTREGTYKFGSKDEPEPYFGEAGVGRAQAEHSIFHAEAKGPNAGFKAEASALGVGAMARAELASASAIAGPLGVKVGLGLDTGASIGADGLEAKFLGTGITIGPKTGVSVLGSEVSASCSVM